MPRRELRADLADVRELIAAGRTELYRRTGDAINEGTGDGIGSGTGGNGGGADYWLESARRRLGELDTLLIAATARLPGWVRTAIGAVVAFLGVLATTSAARAIGLPGGWVIVVAVLTMLVLPLAAYRLTEELERVLEGNRVRPARPHAVVPVAGGRLTEVPEQLLLARTRLVSAILRQAGPADWRVPILARRVTDDVALVRLQDADLLLCQAIDQLETHVAEQRR